MNEEFNNRPEAQPEPSAEPLHSPVQEPAVKYDAPSVQPSAEGELPWAQPRAEQPEQPQMPPLTRPVVSEQPPVWEQRPVEEMPRPGYTPPVYSAPPTAPKPKKEKKKKGLAVAVIAIALCCGLLGSICGGVLVGFALRNLDSSEAASQPEAEVAQPTQEVLPTEPRPTAPPSQNLSSGSSPAQVYADNVQSVVGISNESTSYNIFGQASSTASSGTGFIISPDGEILTNYHVVQGAQTLTVTLYDGSEYEAQVLGYEAASDVALIKINAGGLPAVTMGSSASLYVGAEVAAIGNPLGELTYSLNVGYISSMERAVNTDGTPINMMQIDLSINSGNSGGPLFDMNGNVVGITTAKYSGSTGSGTTIEGIGFAIPIDDILAILDDLRENGAVLDRAYIGILPSTVTAAEAQRYNLPLGAYVEEVTPGYCGEKAGLKVGDIITAIDGTAIESYEDLSGTLKKYRAGDSAVLTVYRGGRDLKLDIVFDARPVTTEESPEAATEATTEFDPWDYIFGG